MSPMGIKQSNQSRLKGSENEAGVSLSLAEGSAGSCRRHDAAIDCHPAVETDAFQKI
jgi:hypothetical protein